MAKTAKQYMIEYLIMFGRKCQLPEPTAEYIDAIFTAFHQDYPKWSLKMFFLVLEQLTKDEKYAESARYGKYPMFFDFYRVRKQLGSKPFYDALSAYLSGDWWEKDNILALATPEQLNAIMLSGGLQRLFERANSEMATPVYKLIDIVAENEADSPVERIDTEHRIGAPQSMKQIMSDLKNKENSLQQGGTNGEKPIQQSTNTLCVA